jgi:hypothetical protein
MLEYFDAVQEVVLCHFVKVGVASLIPQPLYGEQVIGCIRRFLLKLFNSRMQV